MPIDPNIVLQQRQPQMPNLMQQAGQYLSLKNAMQQQKATSLNLQTERMKLDKMRQAVEDETTAWEVFDKYGYGTKEAEKELKKRLGQRALPVLKRVAEYEKGVLELDDTRRNRLKQQYEMYANEIDDIFTIPTADGRQAAYLQKLANLVRSGQLTTDFVDTLPRIWDDGVMRGWGSNLRRTLQDLDLKTRTAQSLKADLDLEATRRTMPSKESGLTPAKQAEITARREPLTKEQEEQEIRIRTATLKEPKKEDPLKERRDRWFNLVQAANKRLDAANQETVNPLTGAKFPGQESVDVPPVTELDRLKGSNQDTGPRRWGGGNVMPRQLMQEYLNYVAGLYPEAADEDIRQEAARMALADGWDVWQ